MLLCKLINYYLFFRLVNNLILFIVIDDRAKLGLLTFHPRWILLAVVLDLRSLIFGLIMDTPRSTTQSAH